MNTIDNLETRLRSWVPRPPSPKVEDRLFHPDRAATPITPWPLNGLVTASAALLMLILALTNRPVGPLPNTGILNPIFGSIPSNYNAEAFIPLASATGWAGAKPQSFEWTNGSSSTSSISSLSTVGRE